MKKYRIGEVAELLNVSKEMIRYYERRGVIEPSRTESNYREYSALDLFSLTEAVVLSNFDLQIKETSQVKQAEYSNTMQSHLQKFIAHTAQNINYQRLMIERAEELSSRIDTGRYNVGRTWVKKVEGAYWLPFLNSHDDQYDEILLPEEFKKMFASDSIRTFVDAVVRFEGDGEHWYLRLQELYIDKASLGQVKGMFHVPEHFALCTIMDMGEIGHFERKAVDKLVSRLCEGTEPAPQPPVGILLQRGVDSKQYRRLMELQIPIKG